MLFILAVISVLVAFWAFLMLLTPIGPFAATGCLLLFLLASACGFGCVYRFLRSPS